MEGLRKSLAAICARQPFALGLLVHLIFFVPVMYVSFLRNSGLLFQGLDGSFSLTLVRDQMTWAPSYLGQTWNPMQSIGNVWFPLIARLFPGYLIAGNAAAGWCSAPCPNETPAVSKGGWRCRPSLSDVRLQSSPEIGGMESPRRAFHFAAAPFRLGAFNEETP